jgi:NADH-quinone oxidoreductase subunit G
MTVTTKTPAGGDHTDRAPVPDDDRVSLTIDSIPVRVPKGTLVIRAAEELGIAIPRFCDHPLLDPIGACRQCLVDVEGQRKPLASCTTTVTDGMVVRTQLTSGVADKAQQGVMEMLLINHPLDCPICDKGGECPLQNQAMSNGRPESRFEGPKRTFPKPIPLSSQVLLDRERCVQCARCTRFADQVAGDPFIELVERGSAQQIGIYAKQPFDSYFSGNTVQICPVGALTSAQYRFRARPFDLVSEEIACEHCASGCALRADHRRGTVTRRLAVNDPAVNQEWSCDKGRWAFGYARSADRIASPLVREPDGTLVETSWPDALDVAARGLRASGRRVGVLVGGRSTVEDAYAYAKFARVALGTNDVDFRARPHSAEEAGFLGAHVAGGRVDVAGGAVTYEELDAAPAVLLAGFEAEEESPIVFLRLRRAYRKHGTAVFAVAPFATSGLQRMGGVLVQTAPGDEATVLGRLSGSTAGSAAAAALRKPGAVILVGERLAVVPGALTAAANLAAESGARLAWVPRRAGERGAVEAGALGTLLPGGRPVADAAARVDTATVWGVENLPGEAGRDTAGIVAAAAAGELTALMVGGVDPGDLPNPGAALAALESVFLVSLEVRRSAVTDLADVVLPVAPTDEKAGSFLDWEGRKRSFEPVLLGTNAMSDTRVLSMLSDSMERPIGLPTVARARRELAEFGPWSGNRAEFGSPPAAHGDETTAGPITAGPTPGGSTPGGSTPADPGRAARLATWNLLLDLGRLQDGEPELAGTRHPSVARLSEATAASLGLPAGGDVTVSTPTGSVTLPVVIAAMPDDVVWLPTNSPGSRVRLDLAAIHGSWVRITPGSAS